MKLNTDNIIQITRGHLADKDEIIFAYLFGSYAKRKQTHLSDIDIAVYADHDRAHMTRSSKS